MSEPAVPADAGRRYDELAAKLDAVRRRVVAACTAAGRDPDEVTTVVVTKTFPLSDVQALARLGVRDVGENRDQEARAKVAACTQPPEASLRWHFVGRLQTNKAGSVAGYADVVHSLDRGRLVGALSRGAVAAGRTLDCLVQVSLDGDVSRGGVLPDLLPELADAVAGVDGLRLRGVMAVAPLGEEPIRAFERLAGLAARLVAQHPQASWVSAGMSADLEAAVACGATHLRVGGAVLGSRPPLG